VFMGNTCDATTVKDRLTDLKGRFGISRTIFVGDRGMLSAANVAALGVEGYQYISSLPTRGKLFFELKAEAIAEDSSCDGRFILTTDAADLSVQQVISSYKDLKHVEAAFDELKNFIEIRPVYHYNEHRVRAHVFICVLSYLLERVLELTLKHAGIEMTARRALQELQSIQMVTSEIDGHLLHGPTEGSEAARSILNALGVAIPKATLTALAPVADAQPLEKPCGAERTLF